AQTLAVAPGSSDQNHQQITGFGPSNFDVAGTEFIKFTGSNGNDKLVVSPGTGDQTIRVDNSAEAFTDRITADSLPLVLFQGLQTLEVQSQFGGPTLGTVVATFAPASFGGAVNYFANLDTSDTLVIEGTDETNAFTAFRPSLGPVAVFTAGAPIVTAIAPVGRLQVNALGGADSLVVNDFGGPILTPITYDGGTGVDSLTIAGGTASSDLYAPGPVLGSGSSTIN